ncbi:Gfo/Idh/MocA family protein [Halosimplex amylolyticum]|uniref:Gfo/Idh/MocA family protein n=1 Tax=Halosimplex amylolyticum TaxID=3396616 RepID=UPI003F57898E
MKFGVIGCGRVAQMMHLPHLNEIPKAEIGAIADPAPEVLDAIGEQYSVDRRYSESSELIEDAAGELDAVVIAAPPQTHANLAVAALEAGLHTFVEKPLALSVEDADRMVEAAEASDATAMVGYMKRHDPTYLEMQDRVDDLESVNRVVGTLVLGQHDEVIEEMYDLAAGDPPEEVIEESGRAWSEQIEQALGTDDPDLQRYYSSHLGASCHDMSALRGLFGDVERVEYVDIYNDLDVLLAVFEFEGGEKCVFTSSFNERKEWEEFVRVETPEETITLEFTNPYLRNDPFTITTKRGKSSIETESVSASYEESFKCELEHFIECVETGGDVRTTFQEGRDDVARFVDLFRRHIDAE